MGIGLGGSSDAYPALDDGKLLNNAKVMVAHDAEVYADGTVPGTHNLLVGRNITAPATTRSNTVIGENVTLSHGVENTTSIGRSSTTLSDSDKFFIGDFLEYSKATGDVTLASGAVMAGARSGDVRVGKWGDLEVTRTGTSVLTPLQVRSRNVPVQEWEFALEPSEDDTATRDLVIRASDGTSVVFCAGPAQTIE